MERIFFPKAVVYRTRDGVDHACPPPDKPYFIIVKDLRLYEAICRSGYGYCEDHTGRAGHISDNRATS